MNSLISDPFIQAKLNPLYLEELKSIQKNLSGLAGEKQIFAEKNLILFTFQKLFQPLYFKLPMKIEGTVFLMSSISSDGIGDFIALHKCARFLKNHYPSLDLQVAYTYSRQLPDLATNYPNHAFYDPTYLIEAIVEGVEIPNYDDELHRLKKELIDHQNDHTLIQKKSPYAALAIEELCDATIKQILHYEELDCLKQKGKSFYKKLIESRAIIHVSLALNTFENPLLKTKSIYFSESGNFQGIANALNLHWYSMGLLPLEEGIFLEEPQQSSSLGDQECNCFVSYITTLTSAKLTFIYLVSHLQKHVQEDLEIILYPLTSEEIAMLDFPKLSQLGIAEVYIHSTDNPISKLPISPKGKKLHLKQFLPLPYENFIPLIKKSQWIVGCTGDLSLSECLSLHKVPFYEIREHKKETLFALLRVAQFFHLQAVVSFLNLLQQIGVLEPFTLAKEIADLILLNTFRVEWETLVNYIKKFARFEHAFLAILNAFFHEQENPQWKKREEKIILSFLEGVSAREIYEQVQKEMGKSAS
ncbi:hypothetical protein PHSC3_001580 [Chlamydiales bacterium STE3]|nr:hypothetical protein PHSC3_001580 [Chlamydiales bacterium STE3]